MIENETHRENAFEIFSNISEVSFAATALSGYEIELSNNWSSTCTNEELPVSDSLNYDEAVKDFISPDKNVNDLFQLIEEYLELCD